MERSSWKGIRKISLLGGEGKGKGLRQGPVVDNGSNLQTGRRKGTEKVRQVGFTSGGAEIILMRKGERD